MQKKTKDYQCDQEQKLNPEIVNIINPLIMYQRLIIINGFLKRIKIKYYDEYWCIDRIHKSFYQIVRQIINGNLKMINSYVIEFLVKSPGNRKNNKDDRSIKKLIESKKRSFPVSISIIEIFLKCTNIVQLFDEFNALMPKHQTDSSLFQNKLAFFLLGSTTMPTEKELMKFLFEHITLHFSLNIFGSSVFDIDNANDLDIVDAEVKNNYWPSQCYTFADLIDSLGLYLNVETKSDLPNSDDHYPDARKSVSTIMISYDLLEWIPGFKEKGIGGQLKEMNLKLNHVPISLFKETFSSLCDFWEMGLMKTYQGTYLRKGLCNHPDSPPCSAGSTIPDLIKTSFLNKTLTPIKMYEDLEHGVASNPPCDTKCKLSHFYNRIKHIRRYIAKTHIYKINENMPFSQNCIFHTRELLIGQISIYIPSNLHNLIVSFCDILIGTTPRCELCINLLTNNSLVDGQFIIKIPFGSGYIHDKCFCAVNYKIEAAQIKMDKILTNFFCKRDTEI